MAVSILCPQALPLPSSHSIICCGSIYRHNASLCSIQLNVVERDGHLDHHQRNIKSLIGVAQSAKLLNNMALNSVVALFLWNMQQFTTRHHELLIKTFKWSSLLTQS